MESPLAALQVVSNIAVIATEQSSSLSGPQIFTIVIAVATTLAAVITAKVFKDKDDQGKS